MKELIYGKNEANHKQRKLWQSRKCFNLLNSERKKDNEITSNEAEATIYLQKIKWAENYE